MIHVSVVYPNGEGVTFDHDYYRDKHMALVRAKAGEGLARIEIDRAIAKPDPSVKPPWICTGHLYFESLEAFQTAFAAHGAEIIADVPNFTNVESTIVISESTVV